jgi:hypothetical protein
MHPIPQQVGSFKHHKLGTPTLQQALTLVQTQPMTKPVQTQIEGPKARLLAHPLGVDAIHGSRSPEKNHLWLLTFIAHHSIKGRNMLILTEPTTVGGNVKKTPQQAK